MEQTYSFEAASALYEESRRVPDAVLSRMADLLASDVAGRWLDVGVGTGRAAVPLAAAGARVTGIDIAPGMMARLRASAPRGTIELVRGDFSRMPFLPASFDAAVAYHALHLVHDPRPLLGEVFAVIKPGAPLYWLADVPAKAGNYVALKERYAALVDGRCTFGKPSSRDAAFIERALDAAGASYRDVTADLAWKRELSLGDILMLFEAKAYSVLFHVPEQIHSSVMSALHAWAVRELPAEETVSFSIRVVRVVRP